MSEPKNLTETYRGQVTLIPAEVVYKEAGGPVEVTLMLAVVAMVCGEDGESGKTVTMTTMAPWGAWTSIRFICDLDEKLTCFLGAPPTILRTPALLASHQSHFVSRDVTE